MIALSTNGKCKFALVALLAGLAAGAEEWTEGKVRDLERRAMEAVADLALVPPSLIAAPVPAKYRAANEVWAMNNGAALTPKGRLWASWIGGGDSPDAYTTCAFSDDNGETWNPPALVVDGHDPKRIPFPRSNIIANLWTDPAGMDQPCARCQVRALASGNWIFVKHLSPPDSYNGNKRIGQIAYLSRDEGKTWEGGLVLDDRKSVTYPDVEQGPDGTIYVTHDFERGREAEIILHRFTEADILAKRFQSPQSHQGIVVTKAMGTKHNQKKR